MAFGAYIALTIFIPAGKSITMHACSKNTHLFPPDVLNVYLPVYWQELPTA